MKSSGRDIIFPGFSGLQVKNNSGLTAQEITAWKKYGQTTKQRFLKLGAQYVQYIRGYVDAQKIPDKKSSVSSIINK
jgi:hypothetical protein